MIEEVIEATLEATLEAILETKPEEVETYADQVAKEAVAEVREATDARPHTVGMQVQMAARLASRKALGLETTHFDELGEQ